MGSPEMSLVPGRHALPSCNRSPTAGADTQFLLVGANRESTAPTARPQASVLPAPCVLAQALTTPTPTPCPGTLFRTLFQVMKSAKILICIPWASVLASAPVPLMQQSTSATLNYLPLPRMIPPTRPSWLSSEPASRPATVMSVLLPGRTGLSESTCPWQTALSSRDPV